MKHFQNINWLALIASALFFGGCIKNNGEAFEAPPDLATAKVNYIDSDSFTSPISLETYRFDTLSTSGREYIFAGTFSEGILGSLKTESYFQFLPESYPQVCPPIDSILDEYTKATLALQTDKVYGKFGTDQFYLYPLTQNLDGDRSYLGSAPAPAYNPIPMFNTQNAARTDNLIRLDANELGKAIIAKWKQWGSFSNDQQFLAEWKGFAIRSQDSVNQISRFDLQYKTDAAPSFLQVFYRVKTEGTPNGELKSLKFRTNTTTVQFYRFSPNYIGTPYESIAPNQGIPASTTNELSAIQGLAGLATKVKLPGLLEWKEKNPGKIKIFKAELEIKPEAPGSLAPPEYLRINSRNDYFIPNEDDYSTVVVNDEQVLTILQSGQITREGAKRQTAAQIFPYISASNLYRCNVTSYVQSVVDGTNTSGSINLYSAQWGTTVNRLLLTKGNVKLRIYYYPI